LSKFDEDQLEQAGINWFKELDYTYMNGYEISPGGRYAERESHKEVVLKERLRNALYSINSDIPNKAIENAMRKILIPKEPSLIENNRNFHKMITDGIDVEYEREDGSTKYDKVWIFDKENIKNNDWLVVNQFTVQEGKKTRRPDLIVFINGLPLVVIELKSAVSENATINTAYTKLQNYKNDIPSLFTYNEILIISDGHNARAGTLTSNIERFMTWRTIDGEEIAPKSIPELEVLIKGVFEKERFLELFHDFILFQDDGLNITKIFAAYHQYHAVKKAINSTEHAMGEKGDRRIGVVWHTQGSGKSLSMVFYSGKLVLGLDNPTIVVITDRNDLDDQLFGTFSKSSQLLRQKPKQADSRDDLKDLLSVESGGIIFTTIQKFEE
jgi:type I restriction enzyme R subunit